MFIDTHCHLSDNDYDNLSEIISEMGSNIIIASGYNTASNIEVINLCEQYNNIYGTIGYHPDSVDEYNEQSKKFLEENICNPKIVGIGEIGLDYHWNQENKEIQKKVFIDQINLANKYNKTIVVHSRDAEIDTYDILKHYSQGKITIHCFSYDLKTAEKFIDIGAVLGIGGIITFKNNIGLCEVVKKISIDKILLETDSPYLSPIPFRGKRNKPSNVVYVANKIAEIKNESIDFIYQQTTKNAIRQFDLKLKI